MYERLLNKKEEPSMADLTAYCGVNAERFSRLNDWLSKTCGTEQKITFPYGNSYGWVVAHRKKKQLICNIFAEDQAFTVMLRMSDRQYRSIYEQVQRYTQEYIDNKYPCGDGGWIQYRITCEEHFDDIQKLLTVKCEKTSKAGKVDKTDRADKAGV